MTEAWHTTTDEVIEALASPASGLSATEAASRLERDGPNALPRARRSILTTVARQFASPLVYILLGALVVSVAAPYLEHGTLRGHDLVDAIVILVILLLNAVLGVVQEFRAERAVEALQALSSPQCRVRRDGEVLAVDTANVVRGDRLVLEAGDRVAADARIVLADGLECDESSLTGESVPVSKQVEPVARDAAVAERASMVFGGTLVTAGGAEAVVTATGTAGELGRIATMVASTRASESPLQRQLRQLGRLLGVSALVALGMVVALGLWRGSGALEIVLVGLALAVSAVPEGLPAVVTMTFALGARRMAERGVVVRRLDSLETLGAIDVIATDKTGTLTENRMTVADVVVPDADRPLLGRIAASCNRARSSSDGDPTETALLAWAEANGVQRQPIDDELVPFSSVTRHMKTRHGDAVFAKGAPETLLALTDGDAADAWRDAVREMAARGLRVLAGAAEVDGRMRMVGLWGIEDPPREGADDAIRAAREAGIRTVMITGDHAETARAIARRLGIGDRVLTGAEIDAMTEAALADRVAVVDVFARVAPEHKVSICAALRARGAVVAMTGDGVNDAPALKAAHVGVAMGLRGTEVAREAASIVLADDRYQTIVDGIREGRRIHDNIRRFVVFLLRANFDELLLVLLALVASTPLPVLPVHILLINLLTDGLPALALAVEPAEPDVMRRPPRDERQHLLHGEGFRMAAAVLLGAGAAFGLFVSLLGAGVALAEARTITLTAAIALELLLALSARSRRPLWRVPLRTNPALLWACGTVVAAYVLIVSTPLRAAFRLTALGPGDWAIAIGVAVVTFVAFELTKLVRRPRG